MGALLEAAPDAMLVVDGDGRFLRVNDRLAEMFGYTQEELSGKSIEALVPARFRGAHADHRTRYFREPHRRPMGTPGLTLLGLRRDGTEFPVEIALSPLMLADRPVTVAAVRDGSARREVDELFRRVLAAAPDAMVVADREGRIMLVNDQVTKLFGYRADELIGQTVERLIPERYRRAHPTHRHAYFGEPRTRPMGADGLALFGLHKDGREFPAEISLSPLEIDGRTVAITAIRDISERKKADAQRERLAQAQESIRLRDEFLSVASHELKTPLTSLKLQVSVLGKAVRQHYGDPLHDDVGQRMRRITRAVDRFERLINQLLDVSRITSGRLSLDKDAVDLGATARAVAEQLRDELRDAGCELRLHTEPGTSVWGDALRVEQILSNLLSNAAKYGAGKPVELTVQRRDGMTRFTVRDHGIGIAPEDQSRIFERFERVVSARHYGGVGLGLWIVRQIIEAHHGTITVWSQPNAGTSFTVDLPAAPMPGGSASLAPDASASAQVLIVDDDAEIRESLVDFLDSEGITCHAEASATSALRRLQEGMRPDVILLDLMMPDMDGWTFREELLKTPSLAEIPVLVVSAVTDLEHRVQTLDAAGFLRKPIEPDLLVRTISRLTRAAPAAPGAPGGDALPNP